MNSTEQRYAQIEKEALALTWACERFSDYLIGMTFHCETDHKPLIPLMSTKNLDELPPRIQRFRMRLMRYHFTISHVPGKSLIIADALSRAPLPDMDPQAQDFNAEVEAYLNIVQQNLPASETQLVNIQHQQEADEVCQQLVTYCSTSWPNQAEISTLIRPYLPVASELSVVHGLLMRGTRIVIPKAMRKGILEKLHEGHQGIAKTRERARQSVWWPGLSSQIEQMVKTCQTCCKFQSQGAQPLIPSTLPSLPWQNVAMDIFEWKKSSFLLTVDYYSRYIEIAKLSRLTSTEVIVHTKSIFARHGIPEKVVSDNGPQFSSREFSQFASTYCFDHLTSSPYFPQSNGEAERAVRTIKQLLKKADDPYVALLAYRNTPLHLGFSPAQLLMSRRLRTSVPTIHSLRVPNVPDQSSVSHQDKKEKHKQKLNFDSRHRAADLKSLAPGDCVWLPDQQSAGRVVAENAPRSYDVETPAGQYRRNRRHVIPLPVTEPSIEDNQSDNVCSDPNTSPPANDIDTVRTRSGRTVKPPDRLDNSWTL